MVELSSNLDINFSGHKFLNKPINVLKFRFNPSCTAMLIEVDMI